MISVEYQPVTSSNEYICLIGKGITFDTGGINIKPTKYITDMFLDKCGAAAMFAAFKAIVNLKINVNVLLCLPLAENSVSD